MNPQDRSARQFIKRLSHRWGRWPIRVAYLLIALVAYRLALWGVQQMIDEHRIGKALDAWAEQALVADMTHASADANLGVTGRLRLNYHDVHIKHPNDALFEGNLLEADPVSLALPVWGLFGVAVEPEVRIRRARARIIWADDQIGHNSLSGFCQPLEQIPPDTDSPLRAVTLNRLHVHLRQSVLQLERRHRNETISIRLNGEVTYDPRARQLQALSPRLPVRVQNATGSSEGSLEIHGLQAEVLDEPPFVRLKTCRLQTEHIPVHVLNTVWPDMLPERSNAVLTGELRLTEDGTLHLQGKLGGLGPTALAEGDLSISAERTGDGHWKGLKAQCKRLDLDALPNPLGEPGSGWVGTLLRTFPAVEADAEAILALGLPIREATLRFGPLQEGGHDLGMVISGERFGYEGSGNELALPLGLNALACRPSGGRTEVLVVREDPPAGSDTDAPRPVWAVALTFRNLAIPSDGAGILFLEFARLPASLNEVEHLRRQAEGLGKEPPRAQPLSLGTLLFTELSVLYKTFTDGSAQVSITGTSPDLGRVAGGGQRLADGSHRIAFTVRELPAGLFARNPALSSEVRAATWGQAASDEGLRIDLSIEGGEEKIQRRYIQDIFHRWLKHRSTTGVETAP